MAASKHGIVAAQLRKTLKAVNTDWAVGKHPNQLTAVQPDASYLEKRWHKLEYIGSNYCKYGMLRHDFMDDWTPTIRRARARMTPEETQARHFRCVRASLLCANKQILPEAEWTPMDAEHDYLAPHIDNIEREDFERNLIKCAVLDFEDYTERLAMTKFRIVNYFKIQEMRKILQKQLIYRELVV